MLKTIKKYIPIGETKQKPSVTIIPAPLVQGQFNTIVEVQPLHITVPATLPQRSPVIQLPNAVMVNPALSHLILVGRRMHKPLRHGYSRRVAENPKEYSFNQIVVWRTCALAAAFAAAFGAGSVERSDWSLDEARWKLSRLLGYRIDKQKILNPWGFEVVVEHEIYRLTDAEYWSRSGVAEWLASEGL